MCVSGESWDAVMWLDYSIRVKVLPKLRIVGHPAENDKWLHRCYDTALCLMVNSYRRFGRAYCLHLHGKTVSFFNV